MDVFLEPGTRLGDRYRIEALIGEGGMAIVYQAFDEFLGRIVAVKVMRISVSQHIARFEREAGATAALRHPSVVRVYDYGTLPGGQPYLVLEFVEGESVQTMIDRGHRVTARHAVELMCPVAGALAEAHDVGIVHRDIKPDNLVVQKAPGMPDLVRLLDFSIAAVELIEGERLTATGQLFGTPEFMPPEQAMGYRTTPAADVWGAGAVLYNLLAGVEPFRGEHTPEILYHVVNHEPDALPLSVPQGLREIVDDCLRKDPIERPPDGAALLQRLQAWLDGEEAEARQDMRSDMQDAPISLGAPGRRSSMAPIGIGVAAGAVLVGALWLATAAVGDGSGTSEPIAASIEPPPAARFDGAHVFAMSRRLLNDEEPRAALKLLEAEPVGDPGEPAERQFLMGLASISAGKVTTGLHLVRQSVDAAPRLVADPLLLPRLIDSLDDKRGADAIPLLERPDVFPRARPALARTAAIGSRRARQHAVRALEEAGVDSRAARLAALQADLRSERCEIRRRAANHLAEMGDRSVIGQLRDAMKQSTRENRCMKGALARAVRRLEKVD